MASLKKKKQTGSSNSSSGSGDASSAPATSSSTGSEARAASGAAASSSSRAATTATPMRQRKQPALSPSYIYKDMPTRGEEKRFQRKTRSAMRTAPTTFLGAVGQLPPEEVARLAVIKVGGAAAG
jgi:hypothetical protein